MAQQRADGRARARGGRRVERRRSSRVAAAHERRVGAAEVLDEVGPVPRRRVVQRAAPLVVERGPERPRVARQLLDARVRARAARGEQRGLAVVAVGRGAHEVVAARVVAPAPRRRRRAAERAVAARARRARADGPPEGEQRLDARVVAARRRHVQRAPQRRPAEVAGVEGVEDRSDDVRVAAVARKGQQLRALVVEVARGLRAEPQQLAADLEAPVRRRDGERALGPARGHVRAARLDERDDAVDVAARRRRREGRRPRDQFVAAARLHAPVDGPVAVPRELDAAVEVAVERRVGHLEEHARAGLVVAVHGGPEGRAPGGVDFCGVGARAQ